MLSIYDAATLNASLALPLDPRLRGLIAQRIASARDKGLADLTHIVVVQPGDTEANLVAEIAWSPLVTIDGCRFGEPGFVAPWDWLQCHKGWWEMIVTVGDGGFAYLILFSDTSETDSALLELCRSHA